MRCVIRRVVLLVRLDVVPAHLVRGAPSVWGGYWFLSVTSLRTHLSRSHFTTTDCAQLGLYNYVVDAYLPVAASALASINIFRNLAGAAFPLFATQMYEQLNPRWASTLLGLVAAVMAPIPIVLVKYGPRLRKNSKYCPSPVQDLGATEEKQQNAEDEESVARCPTASLT